MSVGASPVADGPRVWVVPVGLFLIAGTLRLVVATLVPFPVTEGSAYYVGVARNLIDGQGLVTDALWSYATPPLGVPRPAFELWMPMTTFVSGVGMAVLGPSFWAAQVVSCLIGAVLAPLTWAVARTAARAAMLGRRRGQAVALAAGLLVALQSPFVIAAAVPDSYTPYVVASVAAALLVPGVVDGGRVAVARGLALGVMLAFAYLARQEVVWLGLTIVLATWIAIRRGGDARVLRQTVARDLGMVVRRLVPVVIGGAVVVLPWLVRNLAAFGTPFPGQALENAVLRRNEDIYAFSDRPTLAGYLGQDPMTLVGNPVAAAWDALVNVIVLPAFPVGVVGLLAILLLWRSRAFVLTGALGVLLLSGALTFVTTMLLFPVATRWGTFLHASGPLLVALTVAAALGADALLARISAIRAWEKPNVIIGPIALVTIGVVLLGLQVMFVSRQAEKLGHRYAALRDAVSDAASARGAAMPDVVISDHPIWVADALGRRSVALPAEDLGSIGRLVRTFDAAWLVVMDDRGRYPDELLTGVGRACVSGQPTAIRTDGDDAGPEQGWLFVLDPACGSSTEAGA